MPTTIPLPSTQLKAPGPARMIEEIDCLLNQTTLGTYFAVISREQQLRALSSVSSTENGELEQLIDAMTEASDRAVVVMRFPERFPHERMRSCMRQWAQSLGDRESRILDVLLVSPTHWWSAMCHDEDCCPQTGRPRLSPRFSPLSSTERKRLWTEWQELRTDTHLSTTWEAERLATLIDGLVDLRLRDCILAHAGQHPDQRTAWTQLILVLLDNPNFSRNVALKTTLCALTYLRGDLNAARAIAEEALNIDGSYSLALLLHKGLVTKAPPGTLEAAFRNASIETLIDGEKMSA